ncbi:MAG: lipopolysaccharide heptosyltransferase II, partial [Eubacteriales bacterium]|nr:lipopolysaccharide heptosyltransferase II [Eubacteriales bacterium]
LLIAPSWIGDCVMAQPLLCILKERHPQADLHVFAGGWTQALLMRMPEVDKIINNPFGHGDVKLWQRFRVGRDLRAEHYSSAIILPGSLKSALVPFFARIPVRTGYVGESRYSLINDIRHLDEKHLPRMVDRFVALAFPENSTEPLPQVLPRLSVSRKQQACAAERFGLNTDKPILALCPGAEYGPAKRWPSRHFATLAARYAAKNWSVWIFGSGKDAPIAEEISAQSNTDCINLCGKTNLAEAIDLLALSRVVVCNDSGLMHVAAALDRPLVAIYGSSSPDHTPPLSAHAEILTLDLECAPCFERTCPLKHTDCLEKLWPEQVANAVEKVIAKKE